jgi:hypothetical protein
MRLSLSERVSGGEAEVLCRRFAQRNADQEMSGVVNKKAVLITRYANESAFYRLSKGNPEPIVIANNKFPHAIEGVMRRFHGLGFVFQLGKQVVNLVDVNI